MYVFCIEKLFSQPAARYNDDHVIGVSHTTIQTRICN